MKPGRNIEIADILASLLTGGISAEQQETLDRWLAEKPEHQAWYESRVNGSHISEKFGKYDALDIGADKRAIMSRLQGRNPRTARRRLVRIAAAVAVFVTLGTGLWMALRTQRPAVIPEPDRQMAVLVVGDGDSFRLKDYDIINTQDLDIVNSAGLLSYGDADADRTTAPEPHTLIVPRGNRYNIELSDGTTVYLNADSKLSYPSVFTGGTREVWLEGEAFFEVRTGEQPFVVHGGGMVVTVTGTSFNMMAYRDDGVAETTLATGQVTVALAADPVVNAILRPGQQARVTAGETLEVKEAEVANYTGWKDGLFVFDEESLSSIMRTLGRWYDVDIVIDSPEVAASRYFGIMDRNAAITEILDLMKKTKHLDYKVEGKTIIISKFK